MFMAKRIAILGSTGSIGCQALEVISESPGLATCAIGARNNWELLARQAELCKPEIVGIVNPEHTDALAKRLGKKLDAIFQKLSRLNCMQRSKIVGLEPARADIIVAGILILKTIMEFIPAETITVSGTGLLYGLALEGIEPFGQNSRSA